MDKYTTKEVLLATKDKLGELEKKLNILKEMTCITIDKNIKEIRYTILNTKNIEDPELQCVVSWNDKKLKGKIKNLQVRLNLFMWGREVGLVVRDNRGKSYILNDYYNMYIPDENQKEFGKIYDEILTDEFVKQFLKGYWFYPEIVDKSQSMTVFPNEVRICGITHNANCLTLFKYFPGDNTAILKSLKGYGLTDEMLHELLNIQLSNSYFKDYRREVIDSSPIRNKEIIIPKFSAETGEVNFNIEEDEKKLCLIMK